MTALCFFLFKKRVLTYIMIQCQKRKISLLSGNSPYLASGVRVGVGVGGGGGGGLKVPGLILNFPHIVTFQRSIREHLGVSIVWLLDLTFLG